MLHWKIQGLDLLTHLWDRKRFVYIKNEATLLFLPMSIFSKHFQSCKHLHTRHLQVSETTHNLLSSYQPYKYLQECVNVTLLCRNQLMFKSNIFRKHRKEKNNMANVNKAWPLPMHGGHGNTWSKLSGNHSTSSADNAL